MAAWHASCGRAQACGGAKHEQSTPSTSSVLPAVSGAKAPRAGRRCTARTALGRPCASCRRSPGRTASAASHSQAASSLFPDADAACASPAGVAVRESSISSKWTRCTLLHRALTKCCGEMATSPLSCSRCRYSAKQPAFACSSATTREDALAGPRSSSPARTEEMGMTPLRRSLTVAAPGKQPRASPPPWAAVPAALAAASPAVEATPCAALPTVLTPAPTAL
mmetsp:Transcript_8444/g.23748  ORF Transcript_8444/g.23748 Transcript_8444/m.23748 type:complete len:224 (-) Transcript_8444:94-765(-)